MPTYFADTNLFLQCRELRELLWQDVAGDQDIELLVPRAVQEEIDKVKQSGDSWRTRRARTTSSLFRQIIESCDLRITVREKPSRVDISFPPPPDPSRVKPPALDLTRSDDRIVDEALAYRAARPLECVYILTDDTCLLLTSRQHGLEYAAIPESWLLPREPDERDQALSELKRKIDVLEQTLPRLLSKFAKVRRLERDFQLR